MIVCRRPAYEYPGSHHEWPVGEGGIQVGNWTKTRWGEERLRAEFYATKDEFVIRRTIIRIERSAEDVENWHRKLQESRAAELEELRQRLDRALLKIRVLKTLVLEGQEGEGAQEMLAGNASGASRQKLVKKIQKMIDGIEETIDRTLAWKPQNWKKS